MTHRPWLPAAMAVSFVVLFAGLGAQLNVGGGAAAGASPAGDATVVALGRRIFFDPSLSASGKIACATCHNPAYAYAPPNGQAVQMGGPNGDRPGLRAVPSLRYTLGRTPIWFQEHSAGVVEQLTEHEPPAGGFGWDGRFDRLRDQATFPFLASNEMANANAQAVVSRLSAASYANDFRATFGAKVFLDVHGAFADALRAIERFELTDASFAPFTSKYDAYLDGAVTLSAQEERGKRLFDDPQRGGCAVCHIDAKGANGAHPVFTDYQFEALGVPRNPEIPGNRSPRFFDLGLCGPLRTDQTRVNDYCGLFKTPTLRNVATRHAFFHNGRFHTLRDALRFYVQRDTNPAKWYPVGANGHVATFDDIPARYRANVDSIDPPFSNTHGKRPVWNEHDISDVIAYLQTLTDGYSQRSYDGGVSPMAKRYMP